MSGAVRVRQPSESRTPGFVERCFVVVVLLFASGGFQGLALNAEFVMDPGAGMLGLEVFWAIAYVLSVALLVKHCRQHLATLRRETWILMLVALAVSSFLWSAVPTVTLRHGIAITASCLFAFYFFDRFSHIQRMTLLAWTFAFAGALSFLFAILDLGKPVFESEGTWIGIYAQKNGLGDAMVLGCLVFLHLTDISRKRRVVAWCGAVLCATLLLLSQSMASILASGLLLALFCFLKIVRKRPWKIRKTIAFACLFLTCILILAARNFDTIVLYLGRDPNLTGRTVIWGLSVPMGLQHPWLGFGYGAFWLGAEGPSLEVWRQMRWAAPGGHNGLVDMWLDLGAVGLVITIVGFAIYVRRSLRAFVRRPTAYNSWSLLFLTMLLLVNTTESVFLQPNSIFWILYVVTGLTLTQQLERASDGRSRSYRYDSRFALRRRQGVCIL